MESPEPKPDHAALGPPARHIRVSSWDFFAGLLGVLLWLGVAWMVAISIPRRRPVP